MLVDNSTKCKSKLDVELTSVPSGKPHCYKNNSGCLIAVTHYETIYNNEISYHSFAGVCLVLSLVSSRCVPPTSPVNFLDQTQHKALAVAVFGLVFSKLSVLVLAPDPLPFSKDTPQEIKGEQLCPCPIKTS